MCSAHINLRWSSLTVYEKYVSHFPYKMKCIASLTSFGISRLHPSPPSPFPGEEQVSWRVSQYLLHVPTQQDPQLLSQPACKPRLGTGERLAGLLRLQHLHAYQEEFAVEQLQELDLHLGNPCLLAGCGKLLWA